MVRKLDKYVSCLTVSLLSHSRSPIHSELTDKFKQLLEKEFVDPWGVDEDGRLHVRLGAQLWSELQYTLPECSMVIDNVEEYVVKTEKEMSQIGADWFENYVRKTWLEK